MRVLVTGCAGFIGSHLCHKLNLFEGHEIIGVDNLNMENLNYINEIQFTDFYSIGFFLANIDKIISNVDVVIHLGAISATTEKNWDRLYKFNLNCSKQIADQCQLYNVRLIYASSASVYGDGKNGFTEDISNEKPLNLYAMSKKLFDDYMRQKWNLSNSIGLRFFNVFGKNELHKGSMMSVFHKFRDELLTDGTVQLFGSYQNVAAGEQKRDFVYVDDCIKAIINGIKKTNVSGIFNVGTGQAISFNEVAENIINLHGVGEIKYVEFPDNLKGKYQSYTCADISKLQMASLLDQPLTLSESLENFFGQ